MSRDRGLLSGIVLAAICVSGATANAQIVGDNVAENVQGSWNTASAATMSLRAPGGILRSARADFITRQNEIINRSRSGPIISEQPIAQTLEQQVRIDLLNQLFTDLNAALVLLNNAIRLEAGLPPQLPGGGGGAGNLGDLSSLLGQITG